MCLFSKFLAKNEGEGLISIEKGSVCTSTYIDEPEKFKTSELR